MSLSVGLYGVFSSGLYNSSSIEDGVFWNRLQLAAVDLIAVSTTLFIGFYTNRVKDRMIRVLIAWYLFHFISSAFAGPELTFSVSRPAVKELGIPGLFSVTVHEGEVGPYLLAGVATALAGYLYLLSILTAHYRKTRNKDTLILITGQTLYLAAATNDILIGLQAYRFMYVSEYAFFAIVLSWAYILQHEFIGLYATIEEQNRFLEERVKDRTEEIRKLNDSLKRQAELDPLTGIYNRRFMDEYLEIEIKRARNRVEHPLSTCDEGNDMNFGLAIIDVDHFKRVNDTYGHPAGDRLLIDIVEVVKSNIFSRDLFFRYGGEEFVILFTRVDKKGIIEAADKVREAVANHNFSPNDEAGPHRITVSIGVALFSEKPYSEKYAILKLADDRLIAAKNSGRNRTIYE